MFIHALLENTSLVEAPVAYSRGRQILHEPKLTIANYIHSSVSCDFADNADSTGEKADDLREHRPLGQLRLGRRSQKMHKYLTVGQGTLLSPRMSMSPNLDNPQTLPNGPGRHKGLQVQLLRAVFPPYNGDTSMEP